MGGRRFPSGSVLPPSLKKEELRRGALTSGRKTEEELLEELLRPYRVELHCHSVLSPCAELEMGPRDIAARAREQGIELLALTDHNAMRNVPALEACAAEAGGPAVLFGMEVQTAEDIHVVALFPHEDAARRFEAWLWTGLPPVPNRTASFGYQLVVGPDHAVLEEVETLLVQGVTFSVDEVLLRIREFEGLSVLAHLDREAFSYWAVLGPVPEDLPVDAVELSWRLSRDAAERWRKGLSGRTVVRSSDAHRLEDLDARRGCRMLLHSPTFAEVARALRGEQGRRVFWPWEGEGH